MIQQFHSEYIYGQIKNTNSKRYTYPNVHSSSIFNSQDMEATQESMNRWMDIENVVCMHVYVYTQWNISHKKESNFAICNNVDGPREY